jgi:regulatory protein
MPVIFTVTEAVEKMKKFCAYQERSQLEVRQKLYQSSIKGEEAEFVIGELIRENYLNEERFARAFARGKFRMKQWGKIRIRMELQHKGVSEPCIRKGLSEINDRDYRKTAEVVWKKLSGGILPDSKKEAWKLLSKMRSKGFEPELLQSIMKDFSDE